MIWPGKSHTRLIGLPLLALLLLLGLHTAAPVRAATFTFTASLNGAQETPPTGSPATGAATFVYDNVASTITYTITFANLTAPATVAHIHVGLPGVAGPVIFPLPNVPPTRSGTLSGVLTPASLTPAAGNGINTFADAINAMFAGNTYVNVHSTAFPGGEIRGQILPPQTGTISFFPFSGTHRVGETFQTTLYLSGNGQTFTHATGTVTIVNPNLNLVRILPGNCGATPATLTFDVTLANPTTSCQLYTLVLQVNNNRINLPGIVSVSTAQLLNAGGQNILHSATNAVFTLTP